MEEKKYKTNFKCHNCLNGISLLIPVGVTVKEYLKDNKCEVCGCYAGITSIFDKSEDKK